MPESAAIGWPFADPVGADQEGLALFGHVDIGPPLRKKEHGSNRSQIVPHARQADQASRGVSVISALNSLETGQLRSARWAISSNCACPMPGTTASTVSSMEGML